MRATAKTKNTRAARVGRVTGKATNDAARERKYRLVVIDKGAGRVTGKVTSDAQARKVLAEVLKENAKALKALAKL